MTDRSEDDDHVIGCPLTNEPAPLAPTVFFPTIVLIELFSGLLPGSLAASSLGMPIAATFSLRLTRQLSRLPRFSTQMLSRWVRYRMNPGYIYRRHTACNRFLPQFPVRNFGRPPLSRRFSFEHETGGSRRTAITTAGGVLTHLPHVPETSIPWCSSRSHGVHSHVALRPGILRRRVQYPPVGICSRHFSPCARGRLSWASHPPNWPEDVRFRTSPDIGAPNKNQIARLRDPGTPRNLTEHRLEERSLSPEWMASFKKLIQYIMIQKIGACGEPM